jgi:ParB family transcriptional regulator, chromosome partitioning protein
MSLPLDHLDLLDEPAAPLTGAPLILRIADIDEDPSQPRKEFDDEPLQELAQSIAQRGVLQAISVRRHPAQADRWMLNFGARRLRASKLAGLTDIPATVNETATSYDQVIENEQREGLKPLELALFVRNQLALGQTQAEIARKLGKSPTLITMVCAMIDPPDWLMAAYRSGQCRSIAELYDLRRLNERQPERVAEAIAQGAPITRATVRAMKAPAASREVRAAAKYREAVEAIPDDSRASNGALPSLTARAEAHCAALEGILDEMMRAGCEDAPALRQRLAALAAR